MWMSAPSLMAIHPISAELQATTHTANLTFTLRERTSAGTGKTPKALGLVTQPRVSSEMTTLTTGSMWTFLKERAGTKYTDQSSGHHDHAKPRYGYHHFQSQTNGMTNKQETSPHTEAQMQVFRFSPSAYCSVINISLHCSCISWWHLPWWTTAKVNHYDKGPE